MEVKPITIIIKPDSRPVCAGHFCTVVLHPPNNRGEMLCELTPNHRVAKKLARPSGRYLLAKKVDKPKNEAHNKGNNSA